MEYVGQYCRYFFVIGRVLAEYINCAADYGFQCMIIDNTVEGKGKVISKNGLD